MTKEREKKTIEELNHTRHHQIFKTFSSLYQMLTVKNGGKMQGTSTDSQCAQGADIQKQLVMTKATHSPECQLLMKLKGRRWLVKDLVVEDYI